MKQGVRIFLNPKMTKKELLKSVGYMAFLIKRKGDLTISSKKIKKVDTFFLEFTK